MTEARDAQSQLFAALARAQASVGAARKDKTNPQLRSSASGGKYTSAEGMIQTAKPAMADEGLALVLREAALNVGPPPVLRIEYSLVHIGGGVLGVASDMPVVERKGTPLDKALAIARTFALTYVLRDLLMIPRVGAGEEANQRNDTDHEPRPRGPSPSLPSDLAMRVDDCVRLLGRERVGAMLGKYDDLVMLRRPEQERKIAGLEVEAAKQQELMRDSQ